jgi:glycosyltransferase involved in cell wall biosynthesis
MSLPFISIIIPVFNVGPYVENCIRSVMRQTYTGPIECIIVDDCSTDHSIAIIEQLIAEYDGAILFHVLHHVQNKGFYAARNTGMDSAVGEYLFFLDSDDEIIDNCIEILAEPLITDRFDVIEGKYTDNKGYSSLSSASTEKVLLRPPLVLQCYKKLWGVPVWNRLYSASFIRGKQLRFEEAYLAMDILWSFQIACLASTIYIINKVTYKYNRRDGSLTSPIFFEERKRIPFVFMKEMSEFVSNHHIDNNDVFRLFSYYFYTTTKQYSASQSEYTLAYKSLRPLFQVSIISVWKKNRHSIKGLLYDFHYILPICIAPYWQYIIYYRLRTLIKQK